MPSGRVSPSVGLHRCLASRIITGRAPRDTPRDTLRDTKGYLKGYQGIPRMPRDTKGYRDVEGNHDQQPHG